MNKKAITIIIIILLSCATISLTTFMIELLNGKEFTSINIFDNNDYGKVSIDKKINNKLKRITIKSVSSDIEIKKSNKTRVIVYEEKKLTEINEDENELIIDSKQRQCKGICINKRKSRIEVYLNEKELESIDVYGTYGDVKIGNFDKANINVTLEAGNIKIDSVNDIVAKNKYGDIKIKNVYNYLNVNNNCGNIKIDNINIKKDSKINNDLGDIKIGVTNKINIDPKTDLGDVKIYNNYKDADVTLKIRNNCGSIKVKN